MTKPNKLFSMLRLQRCVWLFVVLWLVEQQNVRSSEAPAEHSDTSELKFSGDFPVDTLGKLHAEAAALQDITASKMAMRILSKKQTHLIAFFVLFLILIKVISVRMKKERKKAEEERLKVPPKVEAKVTPAAPPPQIPSVPRPEHKPWLPAGIGGPLKEAVEKLGSRGRKTKKHGRKDKGPEGPPPSAVPPAPVAPGMEHPVPPESVGEQPYGGPAHGTVVILEDDDEMRELRARMAVVSNLVNVAVRLVDELPAGEPQSIIDALKADVEAAEQAERTYDSAKSYGDPNFESIRGQTVTVLTSSLDKARGALVQLSKLAKQHGEEVHAYCSSGVSFTNVSDLKETLKESLEAIPVASCVATLASLGNASITLQQESEDNANIIRSLSFTDECDADSFVRTYSSLTSLNYRKDTLKRMSEMDKSLKDLLLEMHKAFLKAKILVERIPVGMQGNLVQGVHTVLVKSRSPSEGKSGSGVKKAELSNFKGVTSAYKRTQELNAMLKTSLGEQIEKMSAVLVQEPLSKEETASAAQNMAKIGGTVTSVADEFVRTANSALELASSKSEDVGALLHKLTKPKVTVDLAGDDISVADAVRAAFAEMARQLKTEAKTLSSRAQEIAESNKKEVKYKLDGSGVSSSGLDKKTFLKTEAAQKIGEAKLVQHQLRYLKVLSREIGRADSVQRAASAVSFRPDSGRHALLAQLKDQLETEKSSAKDSQDLAAIAESVEAIQSTSLKIRKTLEQEEYEQLSAEVNKARANLHDAGRA